MTRSHSSMAGTVRRLVGTGLVALTVVALLSACGSSKPAYCTAVNNFKNAAKDLKGVGSPSALVTQIGKVSSTGQAAVKAVKSSFATQTSAVKASLAALKTSVTQLTSSSTRTSALAALPAQVTAVKTAAENLASSAKRCN